MLAHAIESKFQRKAIDEEFFSATFGGRLPKDHLLWVKLLRKLTPNFNEDKYLHIVSSHRIAFGLAEENKRPLTTAEITLLKKEMWIWNPRNLSIILNEYMDNYANSVDFNDFKIKEKKEEIINKFLIPIIDTFINKINFQIDIPRILEKERNGLVENFRNYKPRDFSKIAKSASSHSIHSLSIPHDPETCVTQMGLFGRRTLDYWRELWWKTNPDSINEAVIDARRALALLKAYAGFFADTKGAWGGCLGRMLTGHWNTHFGSEVQKAIGEYYCDQSSFYQDERLQRVDLILALVKKEIGDKEILAHGDLAKALFIIAINTGVIFADINVRETLEFYFPENGNNSTDNEMTPLFSVRK